MAQSKKIIRGVKRQVQEGLGKVGEGIKRTAEETVYEALADVGVDSIRRRKERKGGAGIKADSKSFGARLFDLAIESFTERRDNLERLLQAEEEIAFEERSSKYAYTGNIRRHIREAAEGKRWYTEEKLTRVLLKLLLVSEGGKVKPHEESSDTVRHLNSLNDCEFDERVALVASEGIQQMAGATFSSVARGIRSLRAAFRKRGVR